MRKFLKIPSNILLFVFLTLLTQIGGIVYLVSMQINKRWKWNNKFKPTITFFTLYLGTTLLIIPLLAPIFGREKVKHTSKISPANYMTVLLNRNYIRPELNALLNQAEQELKGTDIEIHYLDANFPFINSCPLLPHLSHNDGKKIDLSLIYETENGEISNMQKSISGYGICEDPSPNEYNQITACLKKGYFQYNYSQYLTFGSINDDLIFSSKGNKKLIESLLMSPKLGKLFIEPHLKTRLNLTNDRIRFHGCQAVRHDNHIHVQL